jgi:hypothetical protein
MPAIVPLSQLNRRAPEAGRIRLGVKTAKAMKSIDTFRFTSVHRNLIEQLAELYGGEVQPWNEPKARHRGQAWQVITTSNKIEVFVQPGGLSSWYEKWSGGGCERRCDGEVCEVAGIDDMREVPCICTAKGVAECDPYTRLNVILPQLDFHGVWRLETKGWNAAVELPGMFDMVVALAQRGMMVKAYLHLEPRTKVSSGQTKNFVVPVISVAASPQELLEGGGVARPQLTGSTVPPSAGELGPPRAELDQADQVDEVVEAVVVMDADTEAEYERTVRTIAGQHKLDPDAVWATLWSMTNGDESKITSFIEKAESGTKTLVFTGTGRLAWRSEK